MSMNIPDWLLKETFAIQYNPNCPKPFLVRLVGKNRGSLDMKQYVFKDEEMTADAIGFGSTPSEAAKNALTLTGER